jgi:hypothetical protein
MKKPLLVLPVMAAGIAFGGPVSSSSADENALGRCPDHYTPIPAVIVTEDKNENGVICMKNPDDQVMPIIHDDPNGQPYRCNGTDAIGNPDCPQPTDVVDDIV